ncbi:MAG: hypothetical protein MJZ24_11340 [Paludibacteraceae bacterium]|nr:hypothetical protein [Candidatus Physcocola equi]MCQ2235319.1 hypothetical protein [Paludibacteraceae bacterium]
MKKTQFLNSVSFVLAFWCFLFLSSFDGVAQEAQYVSKGDANGEIGVFLPKSECEPDPVLDSISIENGKIYVEDHPITLGELSYLMHKVNPSLYEKQRQGQVMYFSGAAGLFIGLAATCTGYHWMENMPSREESGKVMLAAGIPVAACSGALFVWGIRKAISARKSFKRDCIGIGLEDRFNVNAGVNSASFYFVF